MPTITVNMRRFGRKCTHQYQAARHVSRRARHGQHFLRSTSIHLAKLMVELGFDGTARDSDVLEIGPGEGVLTKLLLEKTSQLNQGASRVVAVEIDRGLASRLTEHLDRNANLADCSSHPEKSNLVVLHGDFAKDYARHLKHPTTSKLRRKGGEFKGSSSSFSDHQSRLNQISGCSLCVSNLPYAISSPTVYALLGMGHGVIQQPACLPSAEFYKQPEAALGATVQIASQGEDRTERKQLGNLRRTVLMVQREFADKLMAQPGDR